MSALDDELRFQHLKMGNALAQSQTEAALPPKEPWWKANQGIVGLAPPPWDFNNPFMFAWPTDGYDGSINDSVADWELRTPFARSGHTKAEWIDLADAMIDRWMAWRAAVHALPDE